MATRRRPAEVFPPGDFLREELEERGWTQDDLAAILGRQVRTVNQIIGAKRSITTDMAKGLSAALGTSPEFWLNLEAAYQLWRVGADGSDQVAHRARLYTIAPIREMVRRGWIEPSDNPEVLEDRVLSFFETKSLDEPPSFRAHVARKTEAMTPYDDATPEQTAWLFRAMHLSRSVQAEKFTDKSISLATQRLQLLMQAPQEVRHVPKVLSESGIRYVVVQHLPRTKIDGACFWIDDSPVIAMSIRYDRIDNFWFTLMHELGHLAQDGEAVDTNMEAVRRDSNRPQAERMADSFASEHLVSQTALDSFVARSSPLYTTERIEGFSQMQGVHPGIVVGQLQNRYEVTFANFRRLLVSIKPYLTQSALTDGWSTRASI